MGEVGQLLLLQCEMLMQLTEAWEILEKGQRKHPYCPVNDFSKTPQDMKICWEKETCFTSSQQDYQLKVGMEILLAIIIFSIAMYVFESCLFLLVF